MKNKRNYFYVNFLIFIFLFIVGFSPQGNSLGVNVYAESDSFKSTVTDYLDKNGLDSSVKYESSDGEKSEVKLSDNIGNSVETFTKQMEKISKGLRDVAFALSVVVIAVIGFKFMNSSTSNISAFLRSRKELSNALICVVFITALPYLSKGILEFKLPTQITSNITSKSGQSIGDIMTEPKSYLVDYYKANADSFKKLPTIDLSDADTMESKETGIGKMIVDAILSLLTSLIYTTIGFLTTFVGFISFYPVSFDPNVYGKEVWECLANSFQSNLTSLPEKLGLADSATNLSMSVIEPMANALSKMTVIVNMLYYVIKKFSMITLDCFCYYYGIMHLLGKDSADVMKFIRRFFEGIIGMLLAPHLIEFLLDVDSIIATSIMGITGKTAPGLSILSLLPSEEFAQQDFLNLFFAVGMAVVIAFMAKAFFVRRVELTFNYLASPVVFIYHIKKDNARAPSIWFMNVAGSAFLTTLYTPVFVIISILVTAGSGEESFLGKLVYYLLIGAMIYFGKEVINQVLSIFSIGSVSSIEARKRFSQGIEANTSGVKMGAGAAVGAAALAATVSGKIFKKAGNETIRTVGDLTNKNGVGNSSMIGKAYNSFGKNGDESKGLKQSGKDWINSKKNNAKAAFVEKYANLQKDNATVKNAESKQRLEDAAAAVNEMEAKVNSSDMNADKQRDESGKRLRESKVDTIFAGAVGNGKSHLAKGATLRIAKSMQKAVEDSKAHEEKNNSKPMNLQTEEANKKFEGLKSQYGVLIDENKSLYGSYKTDITSGYIGAAHEKLAKIQANNSALENIRKEYDTVSKQEDMYLAVTKEPKAADNDPNATAKQSAKEVKAYSNYQKSLENISSVGNIESGIDKKVSGFNSIEAKRYDSVYGISVDTSKVAPHSGAIKNYLADNDISFKPTSMQHSPSIGNNKSNAVENKPVEQKVPESPKDSFVNKPNQASTHIADVKMPSENPVSTNTTDVKMPPKNQNVKPHDIKTSPKNQNAKPHDFNFDVDSKLNSYGVKENDASQYINKNPGFKENKKSNKHTDSDEYTDW